MVKIAVTPGQIWRDDCYYLDKQSGECKRKYVLILASDAAGEALTAVFTSKANGLTELPACSLGPPRAGYFIGTPGGVLLKPTWVDFNSLEILDADDLALHVGSGRTRLVQQPIGRQTLCAVLRCLLQSDDISLRQARWLGDTAAALGCPG